MRVLKRNGEYEDVSFDKTINRIKSHSNGLNIDIASIAQKVCSRIFDGVSTSDLDEFTSQICSSMMIDNPDLGILSSRIIISNHHKNTSPSFSETIYILYNYKNPINNRHTPLVSKTLYDITMNNREKINSYIKYDRDYAFDYFGFKTLERAYLIKINGKTIERPQHMFMRVALGIHGNDLKDALETYELMSQKFFTHATPTLFNAGTLKPQCSSCFLIAMSDDSIEGIYDTLKDCAKISQHAGGIGLHVHNIRAKNSFINGTNGYSNGLVPMLRVFNDTARYVDQCLHPDSIIYTKQGIKSIKECVIGDKVITDNGNMYELKKIMNYDYTGDLYEIKIDNTLRVLRATDKHPLWCIKSDNKGGFNINYDVIKNKLDINVISAEFIEAENISLGDFIGFPIPNYIKDYIEFTEEECRMYGIVLKNAYINTDNTLHIKIRRRNIRSLGFILSYFHKKCLLIRTYIQDDTASLLENGDFREIIIDQAIYQATMGTTYDDIVNLEDVNGIITIKCPLNFPFTVENVKKLIPAFLHLPENKTVAFLKGLMEIDTVIDNKYIKLSGLSTEINENIRYILLRQGILADGVLYDDNDTIHRNTLYIPIVSSISECLDITCEFKENDNNLLYFRYKNKLFSKVNSIQKIDNYSGRVIDIEVRSNLHSNFLCSEGGLLKNGGGKRNGSIAIYLEPWHADIFDFLKLKKNTGNEEERARDLFYSMWVPDLFMKQVQENGDWHLFCPNESPGLSDVYGEDFEMLYTLYVNEKKYRKAIKAQELWFAILDSQIETGTPYLCYKDAANRKSNQKNVGVIKSSNLCSEIIEYSSPTETAVCNLASIGLPTFVDVQTQTFDYVKLHEVSKVITKNLNKIIDINYYPTPKTEYSNKLHRPLGIGVQGLADVFALLDLTFESAEAAEVNKKIFETIYHGALECSMELSRKRTEQMLSVIIKGDYTDIVPPPIPEELNRDPQLLGSYSSFIGSPSSEGILQFDLWNTVPGTMYDWDALKIDIIRYGLRNSLFLAPMPTASTSQILGNNECMEPYTSNIYTRRTLAGEYVIVNKHLMRDLQKLNLWNVEMKNAIIVNNGSVQGIQSIPENIRAKYKTVWEISQKTLIDLSADRGIYVDQSQSLNLFVESPSYKILSSMHFYAFNKGLKTGMYYLRTKPKAKAQQFTIDPKMIGKEKEKDKENDMVKEIQNDNVEIEAPILACRRDNPDCLSCGS